MKLYSLALLLFLFNPDRSCFRDEQIDGIGRFKVGKSTVSLVKEIATEMHIPLEIIDSVGQIEQSAKEHIVEIKSKSTTGKSVRAVFKPLCANVRVFYLTNFRETDLDLQSVYLFFENDVLVKFSCHASSQLNKSLESTYGQPDANIVKLYSDCNMEAKSFILTWPADTIAATLSVLVSYDENCQKRVTQEFTMALKGKEGQLEGCEILARSKNR